MVTNVTKSPKKGIQVIARAATILRALENEPQGLSLGKIALRVGLSRSTVQRIVDALTDEHLLIGASPTTGVKLGPAILRMASNSSFDFVEFIRPYITQLSKETGETVDVSEIQKSQTVFVDQVVGSARLNIVSAIGEAFPLHCLASGKAMLSALTEADFYKRMSRKALDEHTPATITNASDLFDEVQLVKQSNIAFDREEHIVGVSAIGTPIQEPGGKLYAISIPAPTVRFKQKEKQLVKALLDCRARILNDSK